MKRVFVAAALAISIHGFILLAPPARLGIKSPPISQLQIVTLNLTSYQSEEHRGMPKEMSAPIEKRLDPIRPLKQKKQEEPVKTKRPVKATSEPVKETSDDSIPKIASTSGNKPASEIKIENDPNEQFDFGEDFLQDFPSKENNGKTALLQTNRVLREARPIYKKNPSPEYPSLARRRGYQGTVILEVLIDRQGRVESQRIFESSGYDMLDRAAISSVGNWVFEPGIRGDEKIAMWVRIPIRFQLLED